jgi:hypothetical protein
MILQGNDSSDGKFYQEPEALAIMRLFFANVIVVLRE